MNYPIYIKSLLSIFIIIKMIPKITDEFIIRIVSIVIQSLSDLLQYSFKIISKYTNIPLPG